MKLVKEAGCNIYDINVDGANINNLLENKNTKVLEDISNRINKYILNTLKKNPVGFITYVDNFINLYSKDIACSDKCPQCGGPIITSKIEI